MYCIELTGTTKILKKADKNSAINTHVLYIMLSHPRSPEKYSQMRFCELPGNFSRQNVVLVKAVHLP